MSKRRLQFYLYLFLILIYLVITLLPAPDMLVLRHYHLGTVGYRLVDLAVILPFIAIWLTAYYGYSRLRRYSELIPNSRDGHQVFRLSQGLMVLAYGLPFSAIVNAWLSYLSRHGVVGTGTATIVHNYVDVIFPVIAFLAISLGARRLSEQVKARPSARAINALVIIFILIGLNYSYLVYTNTYVQAGVKMVTNRVYYMSPWLVIMTLVAPYLYAWFLGLLSAHDLHLYRKHVKGVVYRQAWSLLAWGITTVIIASIAVQYLSTMSQRLNHMHLSGILVIVYLFLFVLAAGYLLIASGAKRLRHIEEV